MNIRSGLICVPSREKERKLRELLILYLYLAELKDYPMYTTAYYPDLSMLPARVATTSSIIPLQFLLPLLIHHAYTNVICVILYLILKRN
jgi:hypothetical protein